MKGMRRMRSQGTCNFSLFGKVPVRHCFSGLVGFCRVLTGTYRDNMYTKTEQRRNDRNLSLETVSEENVAMSVLIMLSACDGNRTGRPLWRQDKRENLFS